LRCQERKGREEDERRNAYVGGGVFANDLDRRLTVKKPPNATPIAAMVPKGRSSRTRKVTVNVAVGLLVPSLTVTVWGPGVEYGTVNLHPDAMLPDASVVQVVGMPAPEPPYETVRLCEATKLEPVMVTDVPTAPDAGLREMDTKATVSPAEQAEAAGEPLSVTP
jgi:hypothetical protein